MDTDTQVLDPVVLDPAVLDPAVNEPAAPEIMDPTVEEPLDPITGSNTSNGNQVVVNSTLDYSVSNLTFYSYTTTQSQENTTNEVGQSGGGLQVADEFSCGVSNSRIGRSYRFDSRQYFRSNRGKARVDRITNFSSEAGDSLELSRRVFKGIGELDLTMVSNKRALNRVARTDTDIIYERPTGKLYFNANNEGSRFGNKGGLFAIFESSPLISSSDFIMI